MHKSLQQTVYPCLKPTNNAPLVLLAGWSFDRHIWQDLIQPLQNLTQVITLDLPGFGDNYQVPWGGQETICQKIMQTMPPKALYAGWSLGGMLATKIAATFPDRVAGIITFATNVSFVERDAWSYGMSATDFQNFYTAVEENPEQALKRFRLLLSQGDELGRQQIKWLQHLESQPMDYTSLLPALSLLRDINNCDDICNLTVPGLHIFGEKDNLVPSSTVQKLINLSVQNENNQQHYHRLKNAGHLVFWPNSRVIPLIEAFLVARVNIDVSEYISPP